MLSEQYQPFSCTGGDSQCAQSKEIRQDYSKISQSHGSPCLEGVHSQQVTVQVRQQS